MEINALGSQFVNQAYIPFSSADSVPASGGTVTFEELLKKAQSSQAQGELPSVAISKKPPIDKTDKLYEVCMELETFLIKNLIKSMRGTVQKTGLLDTGFAGEVYEDMLYDEYAKTFAQNANFGFAEMAYRELSQGVYM